MLRASGVNGGQRQEERETAAVLKAAERAEKAENRAAAEEGRISRATEREMRNEEDEEDDVKAASAAADSVTKYRKEMQRDDDEATLAKAVEKKALSAANREKVLVFRISLCGGGQKCVARRINVMFGSVAVTLLCVLSRWQGRGRGGVCRCVCDTGFAVGRFSGHCNVGVILVGNTR